MTEPQLLKELEGACYIHVIKGIIALKYLYTETETIIPKELFIKVVPELSLFQRLNPNRPAGASYIKKNHNQPSIFHLRACKMEIERVA